MRLTCECDADYDPFSIYSVQTCTGTTFNITTGGEHTNQSLLNDAFVGDVDDMGFSVSRHVGVPYLSAEQTDYLEKNSRVDAMNKKNIESYNWCIGKVSSAESSKPVEGDGSNDEGEKDLDESTEVVTQPNEERDPPGTFVSTFFCSPLKIIKLLLRFL